MGSDMTDDKESLAEKFLQYFQVELVVSAEDKQAVFEVRYRVYCEEFGYESGENFPDKAETDEYDEKSLHCLIRHKSSGKAAGCVRLVPALNGEDGLLPFEKYCSEGIDQPFVESLGLGRNDMAEASRLAVDGAFRRRAGEAASRFGDIRVIECTAGEKRTFSLIAISALLACTALADMAGRPYVFAMMEPFLPRLLKPSGVLWQKAGETIQYHGERALYVIKPQSIIDNMVPELKALYFGIHQQIAKTYTAEKLSLG